MLKSRRKLLDIWLARRPAHQAVGFDSPELNELVFGEPFVGKKIGLDCNDIVGLVIPNLCTTATWRVMAPPGAKAVQKRDAKGRFMKGFEYKLPKPEFDYGVSPILRVDYK